MNKHVGTVYLIGAGPGDPGLITVKGLECVQKADVIIYDYLANEKLLAEGRPDAERIYVGKQSGRHTLPQNEINALIVGKAKEGKIIARLKGGDPFIFGRGGEEAEALADANIPFEVVPGVSAATAVPTYAGIPLTHRNHNATVTFVTGHENPEKTESKVDWTKLAASTGTIVFFMGMKNLPAIASNLLANGMNPDTPVAAIQWGTRPDQRVADGTLNNIVDAVKKAKLGPPAIIVVGDVVKLRQKLNWYESKPLFGTTIVVTRSQDHADTFSGKLIEYGASVVSFPVIEIVPPANWSELDSALNSLGWYDWIIFTSMNTVTFFMERLKHLGKDVRAVRNAKICAIGPSTAENLERYGIKADLIPTDFRAEGLVDAFGRESMKGKKVLFPRAKEARELIPRKLKEQGADVTIVTAYENMKPAAETSNIKKLLAEKKITAVTFTSSSSVRNFMELIGHKENPSLMENVIIACIGPVTARTAEEYGILVDIVPKEYTAPAFIEALADFFTKKSQQLKL